MNEVEDFFSKQPLDLFHILLLGPLSVVYDEKKKTDNPDWQNYSNLLIDKFAIHSGSFYHLSKGIIEHKKSGEVRLGAYDLFTVNLTFRAMMENYITFHHLCFEPQSDSEREFRFLLWKIDSLAEKLKFEVHESDFPEAQQILETDKIVFENTIERIDTSEFVKSIPAIELAKIYNKEKRKFSWRFKISENKIQTLKIIELVRHIFKSRGFYNSYKYTSLHAHSNYLALEYFNKIRGKELSNEYNQPLEKQAVFLICMLIYDIVKMDIHAQKSFDDIAPPLQKFIIGISQTIREN